MPIDGPRSTVFENDLQIYFVEFNVTGAVISNVRIYTPSIASESVTAVQHNNFSETTFRTKSIDLLEWTRIYDNNLERLFIERITPKAVIRRIDP